MDPVFILMITGLTSVGMLILGVRRLRFSMAGLWLVLGKVCETIGLTLMLFLLNLAVGMSTILAWRSLTGRFVSIYIASDTTVLILSLLQALTFQAWRESSRQHHTSESRG